MLSKHSEQESDIPRILAEDLLRPSGEHLAFLTKGLSRWSRGTADADRLDFSRTCGHYLRRAMLSTSLVSAPGQNLCPSRAAFTGSETEKDGRSTQSWPTSRAK